MEKEKKEENKKEEIQETRTVEELLKDLRMEKGWYYTDVVEKLQKLGTFTSVREVKRWENGLQYPELEMIYKLSQLYSIPSKNFIEAKNNSYEKDYHSLHMVIVRFLSKLLRIILKIGFVAIIVIFVGALVWAFLFFLKNASAPSYVSFK